MNIQQYRKMVLIQLGADVVKYIKDIGNSYISVDNLPVQQQHKKDNDLRIRLQNTLMTPLKIQYYLWIWVIYSFYAILKIIVFLPLELLIGIFNSILAILKISYSTYTTFFSIITIISCYIYQQEQFVYFDPSYMYHTFRGQAALKLYGLMFAIEIGQKILTMIGKYLYSNIKDKLEDPYNIQQFIFLIPQMLVTLLYTCVHTFLIFLQYNIYIVVINTSVPNFIIFIFVINLTKMKSVAMKKSDPKTYQSQINLDAKDRLQKTLYLILFQLSQANRSIIDIGFKLFMIFVVGAVIEHIKHITVLRLSPQIGDLDNYCNKTFYKFYLSNDYRTFVKCMNSDFTVIPFAVFFLKMIGIILYSDEKVTVIDNEQAMSAYLVLCQLIIFVKIIMLCLKALNLMNCDEKKEKQEQQNKKQSKQAKKQKVKPEKQDSSEGQPQKNQLQIKKSMTMEMMTQSLRFVQEEDDKESVKSEGKRDISHTKSEKMGRFAQN